MKGLIEIFELLKDYIENTPKYVFNGMCRSLDTLVMTGELTDIEHSLAIDYLNSIKTTGDHWWREGLKQPRIDFLNEQITDLKRLDNEQRN